MSNKRRFLDGKVAAGAEKPAFFLEEESEQAMKVQRAFINHMVNRLEKRLMERKIIGFTRKEYISLIIAKTAARFREWFKGLVEIETVENFVMVYGRPDGPVRIFEELFPDQKIEDFLDSCLNESGNPNPVSVRGEEVRQDALNTIK